MDMVRLQKEPDHIQLEVANLLMCGQARSFRRAFVMAQMKFKVNRWKDDTKEISKTRLVFQKYYAFLEKENTELTQICSLHSTQKKPV